MTIDLGDSREAWLGALRAVVDTGRPVQVAANGVPTGTMLVPVDAPLAGDAADLLGTVERQSEAVALLSQNLDAVFAGRDFLQRDRHLCLAVAVAELRRVHGAFDVRPDEMTGAFYVNASTSTTLSSASCSTPSRATTRTERDPRSAADGACGGSMRAHLGGWSSRSGSMQTRPPVCA